MRTREDIERHEKLIGQLRGLHQEVGALAKKSPKDAVNAFKLKLINEVLASANAILGDRYLPFPGFAAFDPDDVPSCSDVALVLAQYMEETERLRSDSIVRDGGYWFYKLGDGGISDVQTTQPSRMDR